MKNKILIYSILTFILSFMVYAEIYDLAIISPPDNFYTNNQTPTFTFSIYGNTSTHNCTLYIDGNPYGTNYSVVNGTVVIIANDTLSEAAHTWYVNCSDEYGMNTTGARMINVDVTAPIVNNVTVSDSYINDSDTGYFYVNIDFSESMNTTIFPNITFDPSLLGALNPCIASWTNASSTLYNCTIVDMNATAYSVNINISLALDLASNLMMSNVSHSMFDVNQAGINVTPPTVNIVYPLDGGRYNVSFLDLNYTVTEEEVCWYELDGGFASLPGCTDSNLSGLDEGIHTLLVGVNNTINQTATDMINFTVDTVAPTIENISSPIPNNGYNLTYGDSLYISIIASENLSEANISIDGASWEMMNSSIPTSWGINKSGLNVGQHNYTMTIWDLAYNPYTSMSYIFNVLEAQEPTITLSMSSNQLIGNDELPYLVTGTATGGSSTIDTLTLFINDVANNISSISGGNWNFTWDPSEGGFYLVAETCNILGVCVNSSTASNITVDLTAPNTTNNANTTDWKNIFIITLTPNESVSYTSYKIGNLPWQNGTNIVINGSSNVSSGNVLVRYYSVDSAGNSENEKSFTVKYDITAPTSTITGFLDDYSPYVFNQWTTDMPLVNISGSDSHSGINRTVYCTDMTNTCTPSTVWNETLNITAPGITYIRYRSIDNISNTEVVRISRVMILQNNTVYINESLNVTENETNIIVPENNANSTIYVPPNVNATLDFSQAINISMNSTYNVSLNGSINVTVNTSIIIVIELPQNITISGNTSWLGNFNLAKLMPLDSVTVTPDSGYTATKDIVVEIGADDVPLLLDKAIRIRLEGKSAKLLGYYRNGFTKINAVCDNDTQEWADTYLNSSDNGHCRITAANTTDLIIWTKHLSQFVTYTQTEEEDDGGGSDGGGGGGSSGGSAYVPSSTNTTLSNPSVSYTYMFLENGTRIINITHTQIPLYAMALMINEATVNARLKITAVSNPPIEKAETVYKYIQIDHDNLNDSIINGARLQFKVEKAWLSENKIEKNQIVLYRYSDGWTMLNTSIIKEDAASIYYESLSPGLSLFAIATKPKPPVTVVEPPQEEQEATIEPTDTGNVVVDEKGSNPTVVVIIVLAIIVILLYLFYAVKNKKMSEPSKDEQQHKDGKQDKPSKK